MYARTCVRFSPFSTNNSETKKKRRENKIQNPHTQPFYIWHIERLRLRPRPVDVRTIHFSFIPLSMQRKVVEKNHKIQICQFGEERHTNKNKNMNFDLFLLPVLPGICILRRLSTAVRLFCYSVRWCKMSRNDRHSICYRLVGLFVLIIKPFWINHLNIVAAVVVVVSCCRCALSVVVRSFWFATFNECDLMETHVSIKFRSKPVGSIH